MAPGRVLILTSEDALSMAMVPRLLKAGADLTCIDFIQMVRDASTAFTGVPRVTLGVAPDPNDTDGCSPFSRTAPSRPRTVSGVAPVWWTVNC